MVEAAVVGAAAGGNGNRIERRGFVGVDGDHAGHGQVARLLKRALDGAAGGLAPDGAPVSTASQGMSEWHQYAAHTTSAAAAACHRPGTTHQGQPPRQSPRPLPPAPSAPPPPRSGAKMSDGGGVGRVRQPTATTSTTVRALVAHAKGVQGGAVVYTVLHGTRMGAGGQRRGLTHKRGTGIRRRRRRHGGHHGHHVIAGHTAGGRHQSDYSRHTRVASAV